MVAKSSLQYNWWLDEMVDVRDFNAWTTYLPLRGRSIDGASPQKTILGVFALKLEPKFLILKGCKAFFFGWFHLARFWEIWIASVLNFLRDGFGDNIDFICGASENLQKISVDLKLLI